MTAHRAKTLVLVGGIVAFCGVVLTSVSPWLGGPLMAVGIVTAAYATAAYDRHLAMQLPVGPALGEIRHMPIADTADFVWSGRRWVLLHSPEGDAVVEAVRKMR